jgi:hypothetical protein
MKLTQISIINMSELFEIIDTPDKGRCVIAKKSISKDTIILIEKPLVCAEDAYDAIYQLYNTDTDTDRDSDRDSDTILQEYQQKSFESLTPFVIDNTIISYNEIEKHLITLPKYIATFLKSINSDRLRLLIAKFYRNAFRNTSSISAPASAILINGALLNHSCCNNVDFSIADNGNFIFKTNRDIIAGEELCDTYIDTNLLTLERQSRMKLQYNFICQCIKCTSKCKS